VAEVLARRYALLPRRRSGAVTLSARDWRL
jgi:hypothetical protein